MLCGSLSGVSFLHMCEVPHSPLLCYSFTPPQRCTDRALLGRASDPQPRIQGQDIIRCCIYLRDDTRQTRAYYRPVRRHSSADEMGERYRLNHAIDRCKLHNPYTQFTRNVRLPCWRIATFWRIVTFLIIAPNKYSYLLTDQFLV